MDAVLADGPDGGGAHTARVIADVVTRLRAAGCVFAEDEAALLVADGRELDALVARRVAGEPLEQVLGWVEFCGLRVLLDPGVFVPRQRTALLVETAVALGGSRVVDLCCGSGAVGLAVQAGLPGAELVAADLDPAAVACARRNGATVLAGDLFDPLPDELRGRVDLLCVNAPYVPTDAIADLPPEARDHEPATALDRGGRRTEPAPPGSAAGAHDWLAPGGSLLLETSRRQAPGTLAAVTAGGLEGRLVADEDRGATVVVGTRS